jgi:hypothetical protein
MPQISWLADLTNASGFALFAGAVLVMAIGLWRRWVVMGWVYQDEVERRLKAEAALASQVQVTNAIAAAFHDEPEHRRSDRARP